MALFILALWKILIGLIFIPPKIRANFIHLQIKTVIIIWNYYFVENLNNYYYFFFILILINKMLRVHNLKHLKKFWVYYCYLLSSYYYYYFLFFHSFLNSFAIAWTGIFMQLQLLFSFDYFYESYYHPF